MSSSRGSNPSLLASPALVGGFFSTVLPENPFILFSYFYFWLHSVACGILVPPSGI